MTVEPMVDLTQTDVWQVLERIWASQCRRGHIPRTREQIDAELHAARLADEERMPALERIHEDSGTYQQTSSTESE